MIRSVARVLNDIEDNQIKIFDLVSDSFDNIEETLNKLLGEVSKIKEKLNIE